MTNNINDVLPLKVRVVLTLISKIWRENKVLIKSDRVIILDEHELAMVD